MSAASAGTNHRDGGAAAKYSRNASISATSSMSNGQMAYVEPQSCCDMNVPWMAASRTSGTSARSRGSRRKPNRFAIASAAANNSSSGQSASRLSPRESASS